MLCVKWYKPPPSLSHNGSPCFVCLLLISSDSDQSQRRVASIQLSTGSWWTMHLHSGCSRTKPVFPGCQKQAASPAAGKGRCPLSPVDIFIEIYHPLKRKYGEAGNGEEDSSNFCPLSQINIFLFPESTTWSFLLCCSIYMTFIFPNLALRLAFCHIS